jgi:hypothetical protein
MWLGLGSILNDFRKKVMWFLHAFIIDHDSPMVWVQELLLPPIRSGESGESLLVDLDVPISHMWSPSFVPRCIDWPSHVDVVGDFTRVVSGGSSDPTVPPKPPYEPDPRLVAFLEECGEDKPIYIGFGSMVIGDHEQLVDTIKVSSTLLL